MKIASLSTYPISSPFHGGQRRVRAIVDRLNGSGHQAKHFPLFFGADFPEASEAEKTYAIDATLRDTFAHSGKREDVHLSHILNDKHPIAAQIINELTAFQPDVIQFEQPWLFAVFKTAIAHDSTLRRASIAYSSQNVEADLLPDTLKSEALELERDLVSSSDTVISVSRSDAERFKKLGAKQSVIAPNGSLLPEPLADNAVSPHAHDYALFIGSAHQPNAEGYWENFGVIPGFIPPSARLVVVGGVNNLLGRDARFQKFRELNNDIVHNMGVVSEDMLQLLLGFASVICLPIGSGGGTNLKTAEALLSGKPIIAMSAAFRGYEKFEDAPGVFVTDDSKEFKSLIQRFFQKQLDLGPKRAADHSLTWDGTLEPLLKHYGAAD